MKVIYKLDPNKNKDLIKKLNEKEKILLSKKIGKEVSDKDLKNHNFLNIRKPNK